MYKKIQNPDQIKVLVKLADTIWTEHFGTMFAPSDLRHLIQQVQSKTAVQKQMEEGTKYFFIIKNGLPIGYFAYKISPADKDLFLSKLYLLSDHRKKGHGREVIKHLEKIARNQGLTTISLTVFHKNESAIKAYEKNGFKNKGIIKRDFGNGMICDDYKMIKPVLN